MAWISSHYFLLAFGNDPTYSYFWKGLKLATRKMAPAVWEGVGVDFFGAGVLIKGQLLFHQRQMY